MLQTWRVVLERLRVNIGDEGGFLSDGDEPQVAIVAFRSRYRTAGSTKVWRQPYDSSLWPEGVGELGVIGIHPSIGVFEYPPITDQPGFIPDIFGFSVAAFERDNTPDWIIRDKLDDIVETLQAGLLRLVEHGELSLRPEEQEQQIRDLQAQVHAAADFNWIETAGVFVGSTLDSDDEVGTAEFMFTNRQDGLGPARHAEPHPLSIDLVRQRPHPFFPEVEIVTASYTITGRMEIASAEMEFEFVPEVGDPACRPPAWTVVSLPELIQAAKDGRRTHLEVRLDDMVNPQRTAFGTNLVYQPGEDNPGDGWFTPPGHYGEKLTMDTAECRDGHGTDHRWRTELLLGRDSHTDFGTSSAPSLLIYIDDVNVYYQPLAQVASHSEGSDPTSRIQVFCRRYDPPH